MNLISTVEYGRELSNVMQLTSNDVLHIYDVIELDEYNKLIAAKGNPGYVVNDHHGMSTIDNWYYVPLFLELALTKTISPRNFIKVVDTLDTQHCFNFSINKKQVNRFLCIKLVEYFNLTDYDYTWSGVDINFDMSECILEVANHPIPELDLGEILSPIQLPKKFIGPSDPGVAEVKKPGGYLFDISKFGVSDLWNGGLNFIFEKSAISLITESIKFDKTIAFTEKTLYPVLGLTFPIWVGGYKQAENWKNLGFDIFDDVIDHSYQNYETLTQRCFYAFKDNLELLSNRYKVSELRKTNMPRLLQNQQLLLENHLELTVNKIISTLPDDLQTVVPAILKYFR